MRSVRQEIPNGIHVIGGVLTDQEGKNFDVSALEYFRKNITGRTWEQQAVAQTYGVTSEKSRSH